MTWIWESGSLVVCLLTVTALAGCLGGDSEDLDADGTNGDPVEGKGGIQGRVLTIDLDPVADANVALAEGTELVKEVRSRDDGSYRIVDVEPGDYRLQINAPCCREYVQGVTVVEGETVEASVQLKRFTARDLATPFVLMDDWTGFLACGYAAVNRAGDACAEVDPESERTTFFEIDPGLKTITAALVWDAPTAATGNELQYGVANLCGSCTTPTDYYGFDSGGSPVLLRIDVGEGNGGMSWEGIEETTEVQWRVFPPFGGVDVFYQQEFTIHYQLHYHQKAPEGFDPLPDR